MNEHDTTLGCKAVQALLSEHDEEALEGALLEELVAHLETCTACRALSETMARLLERTPSLEAERLPAGLDARLLDCMCRQWHEAGEALAVSQTYFGTSLPMRLEAALAAVTAALKTEGFGVLTSIDVRETMREKLDVDVGPYVILGACHPRLAYQALQAVHEIGLLLPCNVLVHERGEETRVDILDPQSMLGLLPHAALAAVADEARARLLRVVQQLEQSPGP